MGLSFVLMHLLAATPLQAFAAGAALCSTSIGTTFTVLSTTGLSKTRLGVVLGSAAMMDDVMGLVMVQIISNLGSTSSSTSFDPVVVIRPILVAFGFAVGLVLICRFVVAKAVQLIHAKKLYVYFPGAMKSMNFGFVTHMCLLVGMVAGATYAGTSGLFAAYLVGASITWLDELLTAISTDTPTEVIELQDHSIQGIGSSCRLSTTLQQTESTVVRKYPTGEEVFERFCKESLKRVLSPLFFVRSPLPAGIYEINTNITQASIGFSIPITKMFQGEVVWRGVVYTILMMFGKVITCVWLIQLHFSPPSILEKIGQISKTPFSFCTSRLRKEKSRQPGTSSDKQKNRKNKNKGSNSDVTSKSAVQVPKEQTQQDQGQPLMSTTAISTLTTELTQNEQNNTVSRTRSTQLPRKPRSLYPASILGLAMVARGEIGYLIASLAETDGIFSSSKQQNSGSSELYLVVVWAITLCTIIGPVCVGTLVKRVKTLQAQRVNSGGADPLGSWGVTS